MEPLTTRRDWLCELDVRPVINAAATLTAIGGSLMPAPVRAAMVDAARYFVDYRDLQHKVAARIAELTRNEAAFVTCGAAAGIALSVAGCMTRDDPALVASFPDPIAFPRNELVVYHAHRNGYDYAARMTGVRLVEVDGASALLDSHLSERTAAVIWFAGTRVGPDALPIEGVVEQAHRHDIPVIVDAAAQIPPASNLWHFTREAGADLAIFSGGKGLRGPQSSGLVLGRADLVSAVALNASPNVAIGRPMKVGKEELVALLAAVEWTLAQDEPSVLAGYESIVSAWIDGMRNIPGVTVSRGYPSEAGQPHGRAILAFGPEAALDRDALVQALWDGDPRIAVLAEGPDTIELNPQCLEPGEDAIVLEAIRRLLT